MSDNSIAHIKFFRESVKRFSKEEVLHYLEGATFQLTTEMEQTWHTSSEIKKKYKFSEKRISAYEFKIISVVKPTETQTSTRLASHLIKVTNLEDVSSNPLRGQEPGAVKT